MLAGTSLQPPSRSMWLTMYTADTSPSESNHSALVKTQMRHNLQSSHNKGTEKQLQKLTSSIKFHNYRNDFITNNNDVEEPDLMLDDPGTVMASSLVGDSTMEDGHYKAKYEELKLQMENQQKLLADYEAKLARRDQVLCFYKYMFPFNTLLISKDPEFQGGKQEAGANHQRPVQQ